jgi:uncharacterized membrane protein
MTDTNLQFQIAQLRQKNQTKALESIAVFLLALFVTAILPSLLIQYVYAGQQLFEQPMVLELIPVISFAIAVAYFIYAAVANWRRESKAARLEREMLGTSTNTASVSELKAAMASAETKVAKPARRSTTKAKRTTRRK